MQRGAYAKVVASFTATSYTSNMVPCLHVQGHGNDPNSSNPAHYHATILHHPLFQSAGLLLSAGNVFPSRSLVPSLALGGTLKQSQGMGKTTKDRDCEKGPGLLQVTFLAQRSLEGQWEE